MRKILLLCAFIGITAHAERVTEQETLQKAQEGNNVTFVSMQSPPDEEDSNCPQFNIGSFNLSDNYEFTRASPNEDFPAIDITCTLKGNMFENSEVEIGYALYYTQETQVAMLDQRKLTGNAGESVVYKTSLCFGKGIKNGIYRIVSVSRRSDTEPWIPNEGSANRYIETTISGNTLSLIIRDDRLIYEKLNSDIRYATVKATNQMIEGDIVIPSITQIEGDKYTVNYTAFAGFRDCRNITSVTLPNTIKSIQEKTFSGCSSLKMVTIPQALSEIGDQAFDGCISIDTVIVRQRIPLSIDTKLFEKSVYENATLVVPSGCAKYFKWDDVWAKFAHIKEMEMEGIETSSSPYDNIEENQMILAYETSNTMNNGVFVQGSLGGRNAGCYKACVRYTREQIAPFVGNHITNVRFGLDNTDISDMKIWIGSSRNTKDLYEQNVTTLQEGWNEVELQTPFAITGDSIFIGIEYTQSGMNYPIRWFFPGYGGEDGCHYMYGPYNGTDKASVWIEGDWDPIAIQCIVEGDHIPQYDIHTIRVSTEKYMKKGEEWVYSGLYLRNWGKRSGYTARIVCEIDGWNMAEFTTSGIQRTPEWKSVQFLTKKYIAVGQHKFTMRVKKINGEPPVFAADDSQTVTCRTYTQSLERQKVLYENYTGTWCALSAWSSKRMEEMDKTGRIELVNIHLDDGLSCDVSDEYRIIAGPLLPAVSVDRYANYGTSVFGDIGIENAMSIPSMAELDVVASYEENSRNVNITVKGRKNKEFDLVEGGANLTVWLTEDSIVYPQYTTAGKYDYEYVHNGVLRTNISAAWGDPITWEGDEFEMHYTAKLNDEWIKDNVKVVAFLAKPFTGRNFDEIGVINCNHFTLRDAPIVNGIDDFDISDASIDIDGRNVFVTGKDKSLQVFTVKGTKVGNCNLKPGIYIVKVETPSGVVCKKIAIK